MSHPARALLVLSLLSLTSGCSSTRLMYNNADWMLRRELAKYTCPTQEQRAWQRAQVDALHRWHRRNELPRYARALRRLAKALDRPLTRPVLGALYADIEGARDRLTTRTAGALAEMLSGMSEQQLRCLEQNLERWREEVRQQVALPDAEYVEARRAKLEDRLEDWVGDLSLAQRAALDKQLLARKPLHRRMVTVWQAWARGLRALLHQPGQRPERRARLVETLNDRFALYSAPQRRLVLRWERSGKALTFTVARLMSAAQRARLKARLLALAADLEGLAKQ